MEENEKTWIDDLKEEIDTNIKPNNHKREITGEKLNTTLKDMVDGISENIPQSLGDLEGDSTHQTVTEKEKEDWSSGAAIFTEAQEFSDAQRTQALANVSNQEAGYDDSSEPSVFTGKMGYVVLQPETDDKTTFAVQIVNKPNTIFEIRDVFELQDSPITIPSGSTLKFNGGRINGGTINLNGCFIDSEKQCFGVDSTFTGTIKNTTVYSRWFGFVSADDEYTTTIVADVETATRNQNPTDNIKPIKQLQSLLNNNSKDVVFEANMFIQSTVYAETQGVSDGNYINNDTVVLYLKDVNARINLNGSTIKALRRACRKHSVICCKDSNVEIYNGKILGFAYGFDYPSVDDSQNYEQTYGINQEGGYVNIHDVEISFVCGDAVRLGAGTTLNETPPPLYTRQIGNYDVSNCKIHDCGRNGISLKTSKVGHVSSTIIYNIGNGNADYVSGPSNVYPLSPKAGIDIEFEDRLMIPVADRLLVEPVILLENLTIYDCGSNTIASAYNSDSGSDPGRRPTVKALTISNSELIGALQIGNTLGNVLCIGCHIKGGNQNFSGNNIQYTNCKIEIDAGASNPVLATEGKFLNCNISDYSLNETYNSALSSVVGRFVGCVLNLHNTDLGDGVFKNCSIKTTGNNIKYNTPIIDSCEVDGLVLWPSGNLNTKIIDFRNSTIKNVTNQNTNIVLKAEGCVFKDTTIYNLLEISLFGCVFDNLDIATLTSQYNRKIENCSGSIGQKNLYYCDIIGSDLIFNKVETGWGPFARFSRVNIVNSTIIEAESGYTETPRITGSQSKIVFKTGNIGTKNMVFTKCILDSESDINVTNEFSFAGVAKDCIFKTPIPTHGNSATRPDASSMPNTYAGFTYFDETLGYPLYLKVDVDPTDPNNPTKSWVKADGTALV